MKKQNTNYTFNVEGSQNQMNVANSEGVQHNNAKESLWKKVAPYFLKVFTWGKSLFLPKT